MNNDRKRYFVEHRGDVFKFIKCSHPSVNAGYRNPFFDRPLSVKYASPPREARFFGRHPYKVIFFGDKRDKYKYSYLCHGAAPVDIILAMFKNFLAKD